MNVVELKAGQELLVVKEIATSLLESDLNTNKDGRITSVVSSESPDSDRDIVHVGKTKHGAGWVLDHFNAIPLIGWQHDMRIPNLSGTETRAKKAKDQKLGRVLVLDPVTFDEPDPFAAFIKGKVERNVIRESSVGFRGKTFIPLRGENNEIIGREFFEQELIEVSFANRGANPDTDTLVKSMLLKVGITEDVEDAGDSEVIELKQEIADLTERVGITQDLLKALGDRVSSCEEGFNVIEDMESQRKSLGTAGRDLLASLTRVGTAHK